MYIRGLDPSPEFTFNKSRYIISVYTCTTLMLDLGKKKNNNQMGMCSLLFALNYAATFLYLLDLVVAQTLVSG